MTCSRVLQSTIGRFQTGQLFASSLMRQSFTAKEKDGLTYFLIVNVLEAKVFRYNFLEGHNVWENDCYSSSTQRNVVAKMATKPEFLVARGEM